VSARQILAVSGPEPATDQVSIVVVRDQDDYYGLAVDRLVGVFDLSRLLGNLAGVLAAWLFLNRKIVIPAYIFMIIWIFQLGPIKTYLFKKALCNKSQEERKGFIHTMIEKYWPRMAQRIEKRREKYMRIHKIIAEEGLEEEYSRHFNVCSVGSCS